MDSATGKGEILHQSVRGRITPARSEALTRRDGSGGHFPGHGTKTAFELPNHWLRPVKS